MNDLTGIPSNVIYMRLITTQKNTVIVYGTVNLLQWKSKTDLTWYLFLRMFVRHVDTIMKGRQQFDTFGYIRNRERAIYVYARTVSQI